jgi:hypothetical protein
MPTRTIRDALLDSERYHACPIESRLLFLELLLCADDYGLVPIGDVYLRRHTTVCEGKTVGQIAGFLAPMVENDLLRCYTSDRGGRFAFIPRFDNRAQAQKPKWPPPPDGLDQGYVVRMMEMAKRNKFKGLRENDQIPTGSPTRETETETETVFKTPTTSSPSQPKIAPAPAAVAVLELEHPKPKSGPPPCPYQRIADLWNECAPNCKRSPPDSDLMTDSEKNNMRARWEWIEPHDTADGLDWLRHFFEKANRSKFMTGQVTPRDGQKPFRASLHWLMTAKAFMKHHRNEYS